MSQLEKPVLVHIGYQKTGTTWLQKNLFDRWDRGFYPLLWKDKKETGVAKDMGRLFYKYNNKHLTALVFEEKFAEIKAQFDDAYTQEEGVASISQEGLVGSLHHAGFDGKEVADRIHALLPGAKILIVIREQVDMIISTYYQYLKMGGTQSLWNYMDEPYLSRLPGFTLEHFEYHRLIQHYQRLFGAAQVLVLPYELFRKDPGSFIRQLKGFTGADIPADLPFGSASNKTPNKLIAYRTRVLNIFLRKNVYTAYSPLALPEWLKPLIYFFRGGLIRLTPASTSKRFNQQQKQALREKIGDYFQTSNARTEQLTGLKLQTYGYNLPASAHPLTHDEHEPNYQNNL